MPAPNLPALTENCRYRGTHSGVLIDESGAAKRRDCHRLAQRPAAGRYRGRDHPPDVSRIWLHPAPGSGRASIRRAPAWRAASRHALLQCAARVRMRRDEIDVDLRSLHIDMNFHRARDARATTAASRSARLVPKPYLHLCGDVARPTGIANRRADGALLSRQSTHCRWRRRARVAPASTDRRRKRPRMRAHHRAMSARHCRSCPDHPTHPHRWWSPELPGRSGSRPAPARQPWWRRPQQPCHRPPAASRQVPFPQRRHSWSARRAPWLHRAIHRSSRRRVSVPLPRRPRLPPPMRP